MIFKRKKQSQLYHPQNQGNPEDWLICNALIGAQPYTELGSPLSLNDELMPSWYTELRDEEKRERVWRAQETYVVDILKWLDDKHVIEIFFDGAYQRDEKWFHRKYAVDRNGHIGWQKELVKDLPKVNIQNVYIRTKDDTICIAYESWDSVFIKDTAGELPEALRKPTVVAADTGKRLVGRMSSKRVFK